MGEGLTHIDERGQARMVDVAGKDVTVRTAVAIGEVHTRATAAIREGGIAKGDVLATARIAGIMAAKRTSDLVPMCHPIAIHGVVVDVTPDETEDIVRVRAQVRTVDRTGVEMEALTAVQVGLLTIYDMCKAADRGMVMEAIRVLEKRGGKSGDWSAP